MTISVAMCTYNGARYLQEQLDSIAKQTRQPDEVVICDDGSGDATLDIATVFANESGLKVRLCANEVRLGTTANFDKAITLCSSEIVVLADQDDVWYPAKLEQLHGIFEARHEVGLVYSDAAVIDDDGQPLGFNLFDRTLNPWERRLIARGNTVEALLRRNFVTGATLAVRSSLKGVFLPIPTDLFQIHDGWIALTAAVVSVTVRVDKPLMAYRQHAVQQVGLPRPELDLRTRAQQLADEAEYWSDHAKQVRKLGDALAKRPGTSTAAVAVGREVRYSRCRAGHFQARAAVVGRGLRSLPIIGRELATLRYHRYADGFWGMARDLRQLVGR